MSWAPQYPSTTTLINILYKLILCIIMSDEWSEDTIDYLLSCLEIAKNLDIEDDSCKHNSPFPEIGPVEIYRSLNAGPNVEFKPACWDTIYSNTDNLLEFTGYVSAAIAKNQQILR